jgi:hypothetical protein
MQLILPPFASSQKFVFIIFFATGLARKKQA